MSILGRIALYSLLATSSTVASWTINRSAPINSRITRNSQNLLCRASSTGSTQLYGVAQPFLHGVASAGISKQELKLLEQAFVFACQDQEVGFSLEETKVLLASPGTTTLEAIPPGATGRVLLLRQSGSIPDYEVDDLQSAISNEIDELLYADPPLLSQPILLSIEDEDVSTSRADCLKRMEELVKQTVDMYEMEITLPRRREESKEQRIVPTEAIEVDGAMVTDATTGDKFWDTSSLSVFDDLVDDKLRERMLDVVVGREDLEGVWDDDTEGPDNRRWVRGGLTDIPGQEVKPCWGLSDEAIDDLCMHHDAFEDFETILSDLFPDFYVSRLPEAVLGDSVSPLTANAPTHGDEFAYHIDADPNMTPPSPWTDIYGRYPNRQPGKPRFVSCLIYLNKEWKEEWGASTRFLDVSTDTHYDVQPRPGRCVFMDQDITHCVVPPTEEAGPRPRYSLVWKLILRPKVLNQDMKMLGLNWPDPIQVGSAKR